MWTVLTWNEGNKPYLYLIETEKLEPYKHLNGLIVNEDKMSEDDNDTIIHLAMMLGREPYDWPIPSLKDYLIACRKLLDRKREFDAVVIDNEEQEKKLNKGPWSGYELKAPFDISRYVNNVFISGWYT